MDAIEAKISAQGNIVRDLKKSTTPIDPAVLEAAVEKLLELKKEKAELVASAADDIKAKEVFREGFEALLLRKFFFVTSFELYGGVNGLYDYGPPGCAIMANLQQHWRNHFVLHENMLEIGCSSLTPECVLKTSGHVDRFTDYTVYDAENGDAFRADKLLEDSIEQLQLTDSKADKDYTKQLDQDFNAAGSMNKDELETALKKYNVTVNNGHALTDVTTFNLMFKTSIGPTGKLIGYLRPETAQGIFVNFRRLYEYNNRRLPFAAAQIGNAYRNEISPRGGLLRVREFTMAEIEHFVHPERKQCAKFSSVSSLKTLFWPAQHQVDGQEGIVLTLHDAVNQGYVANETLGYFLGRTYKFLLDVGVNPDRLRFRQHRKNEMAHYACDCWDAEIHTSYGWVECVGHADRSAYDLQVHSAATNNQLNVSETLAEPIIKNVYVVKPNRGLLGKKLRQKAGELFGLFETIEQSLLATKAAELAANGVTSFILPTSNETVELDAKEIQIIQQEQKINVDVYTPHVIEPSFGLGRIIYSLLEHAYYVRENDDQRKVIRLSPLIAPIKVGLYNVVGNIPYQPIMEQLRDDAIALGLAFQEDVSKNSIGRKYSRGDEIGTPYAISIDSQSVDEQLVTIRERDSTQQVQVKIDEAIDIVHALIRGRKTWETVYNTYPQFNGANESL